MTTIEAYIYPQPAARRVCSTCHAQMVNVGRDVWVCPTQAIEPKGVSREDEGARQRDYRRAGGVRAVLVRFTDTD
jgi:hypothetical protein